MFYKDLGFSSNVHSGDLHEAMIWDSKPRSAQGRVFDINRKGALPNYGKIRLDGTFFQN